MPTYEYKCEGCKNIFEELAQIKDFNKRLIVCPKCNKKLAHKIISKLGLIGCKKQNVISNPKKNDNQNKSRAAIKVGKAGNVKLENLLVKGGHVVDTEGKAKLEIKNCNRIP